MKLQRPIPDTWPIPLTDDCYFVDNSTQEKMMTCKRSAGYYISHRRELSKSNTAQTFGKIVHKALEVRYREGGTYLDGAIENKMVAKLGEEFANYTPEDDDYRNYSTAVAVIKKYSTDYKIEDFEPFVFPNGTKFVEMPFALPLGTIKVNEIIWVRNPDGTLIRRYVGSITVVQKGKIDLVYTRDGKLYGHDHKTTSVMGAQFFQEFELASQVHCYSWAIEQLTGQLPNGFVIGGLGVRKPTPSGKALEFTRRTISIFPALVEEWKTDTMQITGEFIAGAIVNQLPKGTKWCVGKYGLCGYKAVCGLEPKFREMSLYSNEYRDVTWDPLHE